MPQEDDITDILRRELKAKGGQLVVIAARCKSRYDRSGIEVDDLYQQGVLELYQYARREMAARPEQFSGLSREQLYLKLFSMAAVIMRRRAIDSRRKATRDPDFAPLEAADAVADDGDRRQHAAREELDAIAAQLSGPALMLLRLARRHGLEDVAMLAKLVGKSPSQTYRLLGEIRQAAEGLSAAPRRRVEASSPHPRPAKVSAPPVAAAVA